MKIDTRTALVWAGSMLALAIAAKFAHDQGYISSETTQRVVAMNGLWMVYYGNRIPKKVTANACIRQLQRISGWSSVLSGFIYAGVWIFAPIPVALTVGTVAVAGGVAVTLGYAFWYRRERTSRPR
jgi:hypothetical protein